MSTIELPLLVEPEQLRPLLGSDNLLVVDLSKSSIHAELHVPGAVFGDYGRIVAARPPTAGLVPPVEELAQLMGELGIDEDVHVVAYDHEGGGNAARLLWTLELLGHTRASLLNGGLHAWANERHPLEQQINTPTPRRFVPRWSDSCHADADYILSRLQATDFRPLDARSRDEYTGARRFSARGGHIPGAVNLDWMETMDRNHNLRFRPTEELMQMLERIEITPNKEVVVYCQTHHRSSHSWFMLKSLGFQRVRGYPGSWSDWGNRMDLPIEAD